MLDAFSSEDISAGVGGLKRTVRVSGKTGKASKKEAPKIRGQSNHELSPKLFPLPFLHTICATYTNTQILI